MKSLLTALVFALFTIPSFAQVDVSVNPIGLLFGDIGISGDFAISEDISVDGQINYTSRSFLSSTVTGFSPTVMGKYYFDPNNGADKWYAGVFTGIRTLGWEDTSLGEIDFFSFGLGFAGGFKWVADSGFLVDINAGYGRAFIANFKDSDGNEADVSGFPFGNSIFQGKLGVGWRF